MSEEKKLKIAMWASVIVTVIASIALVVTTVWAVKRTTDAIKYDLNCVTEPTQKPLTDCKE